MFMNKKLITKIYVWLRPFGVQLNLCQNSIAYIFLRQWSINLLPESRFETTNSIGKSTFFFKVTVTNERNIHHHEVRLWISQYLECQYYNFDHCICFYCSLLHDIGFSDWIVKHLKIYLKFNCIMQTVNIFPHLQKRKWHSVVPVNSTLRLWQRGNSVLKYSLQNFRFFSFLTLEVF